jgi:hypothetical protein
VELTSGIPEDVRSQLEALVTFARESTWLKLLPPMPQVGTQVTMRQVADMVEEVDAAFEAVIDLVSQVVDGANVIHSRLASAGDQPA